MQQLKVRYVKIYIFVSAWRLTTLYYISTILKDSFNFYFLRTPAHLLTRKMDKEQTEQNTTCQETNQAECQYTTGQTSH